MTRFVELENPDILCLQEIKIESDKFPIDWFEQFGYVHHFINGQRAYHGVAILSKLPISNPMSHHWCGLDHARHSVVSLGANTELHNVYIPAGGDEPDIEANPKFKHKLDMLEEMACWFSTERRPDQRVIIVGDLNIAPLETDVWSHKQLLNVVSHTPVEVEKLGELKASLQFVDAVRKIINPETKLYSWWSYRARSWEQSDRGRRLDHIWVTQPLADSVRDARVTRDARGWEKPSDHVPVTVDLEI